MLLTTSCGKSGAPENPTLADAKTFDDSLTIATGQRLGLMALYDLANVPDSINKEEMMRGALDVISKIDTANMSYIYGLSMGQMLFMNYKNLSNKGDIDKELFINAAKAAFMSDTVPSDTEAAEIYRQFNDLQKRADERAREKAERALYETPAAKQNRQLADAVSEKLMSNPEYSKVGNGGILMRTITPGNGEKPDAQDVVLVDVTISRIDSRIEIQSRRDAAILAGNPRMDLLQAVLPYLSMNQTAEFFVPYEYAFGVGGDERLGVGPCESVLATVTLKPRH